MYVCMFVCMYVCISLNVIVVARQCAVQCSCQRKRLAFTTIAATYVTSILVLTLVPNYWVSAFMAANMYTNCLQVVKLYATTSQSQRQQAMQASP